MRFEVWNSEKEVKFFFILLNKKVITPIFVQNILSPQKNYELSRQKI
jgi:hypothetical protein